MTWTRPDVLKAQLMRLWERGELQRDVVSGHDRFPLRLALKTPSSAQITDQFNAVREWVAELAGMKYVRVEWQTVRHRVHGTQKLPACVWVETCEEALTWLGKRKDHDRFSALVSVTRQTHAALLPWLEKRPLHALELSAEWPGLLAVVEWMVEHPRPGIYLRQVDLPGIHSKFIEIHRGVLAELLDLALPADAVDTRKMGISQFPARYGFLEKPTRIRFRVLDPTIRFVPGSDCPDVTLDAISFSLLDLNIRRVFITENETNFLAFPRCKMPLSFLSRLRLGCPGVQPMAEQLRNTLLGDIDTHGFGILDQLRNHFEHVTSFLMDKATLEAHAPFWGHEANPLRADLHRLTPEESALYNDLRDNRLRAGLRLEQEYIGFGWLTGRLLQLGPG
ncbi:DUF3322 domain-containing protein [Neopusillimonas aromaticivorans]|uniref:DUF3322 domain-containing protein n=1 Tax=Neopusillimonas aromaticivorans TaxID=2979868 RepID=UPI00259482D6|nr:DUF3322 domain-containing protein [Neopusillimonas aromaticivorans]WJJ93810.1 DUF3322 domain-containing protein [Neopusillimonas aromaticivorans]